MTILEAIKQIMSEHNEGMTSQEVYDEIIKKGLYKFGAQQPVAVVNSQIRRRCVGLDFPTAFPVKVFEIVSYKGKKPCFSLLGEKSKNAPETKTNHLSATESLPEEKVLAAYNEHVALIKEQLINQILDNTPLFFEYLVMDLLLKMGYGYDKTAGTVTGRSHDGGVDGIISEDKLGLDLIYIQAKRYGKTNKVGRKELQSFVGAMENIQKGVFITSSTFTNEAKAYAEKQQQKSIKLIDGSYLADLLIRHEVGISKVQAFAVYKIDFDYYGQ